MKNNENPPSVMIQGTCSNAGKSILTTAFCRIFSRRGMRVAPFKAQNMSLNSFVTADGGEMGRAQALQAESCGLEPDVRMNPILLKPVGECGSQLIVLGKVNGHISAKDYAAFRQDLWAIVKNAYDELAREYDLIILEGAGSPAEINLRRHDIVNMRMAKYARSKVFLAADIDRGGAFAALLGTMQLLTPCERSLVSGFILNKFRGDSSLLSPAIRKISRLTKRPFLGVVPWIPDIALPDEDSVSWKRGESSSKMRGMKVLLDVAVVDVPYISNTSDFDALRSEDDVSLRKVHGPADFGVPDCLILPGTRNTLADWAFLRKSGLAEKILDFGRCCKERGRGMLIGICGGFQLLGARIEDPLGVEGGGSAECLGFFPFVTTLFAEKTIRKNSGNTLPSWNRASMRLEGYEIHHGRTSSESDSCISIAQDEDGRSLGLGIFAENGHARIWGTYLHGVFDGDEFRQHICNILRWDHHLPPRERTLYARGKSLDRLADVVEKAVPLQKIQEIIRKDKSWF